LFNTNLVADPGFEIPYITNAPYVSLVEGDSISAWMALGSIDLISANYWNAAEGGQSVDLDGCGMGGVTQVVPTRAGAAYELCFALAANPDGPPSIKKLEVLWDGRRVAMLTVSSAGSTRQRMRWTYHRYEVVGRGGTSVLTFRSLTEGCYGAVIDDVKLQEKRGTVARSNLSSNDRVSLLQ
jgi:choice-of-anchor C domain-containing protein